MPVPWWFTQWTWSPPLPTSSFASQTVIITGANIGLGFEAAKQIVRLGAAKVIITARSTAKGEAALEQIESATGKKGIVEFWLLDLASYQSVKEFAKRVEGLDRLDVLLENAGIATSKFEMAEEDEVTITTNVVSTILLGLLVLPKLKETARKFNTQPHLTIITSGVHSWTDIKPERKDPAGIFAALSNPKTARMGERYPASKLLEVFAVREIVERYAPEGYPVIINLATPGLCHSGLMRELGWFQYIVKGIYGAWSSEQGGGQLVNACAFAPESHGKFLRNCEIGEVGPFVRSEEGKKTQKRVWEELSKKLEDIRPGILENF